MTHSEFMWHVTRFWQTVNERVERSPDSGSERAYHGLFTRNDPPEQRKDIVDPRGYVP